MMTEDAVMEGMHSGESGLLHSNPYMTHRLLTATLIREQEENKVKGRT